MPNQTHGHSDTVSGGHFKALADVVLGPVATGNFLHLEGGQRATEPVVVKYCMRRDHGGIGDSQGMGLVAGVCAQI